MSIGKRTRQLLIRAAAVAFLAALALLLYNLGKGYLLLLDNKTVTIGGAEARALETVRVQVDGHEPIELYPRDRDQVTVTGAGHSLTFTVFDRGGRELETRRVRFRLPRGGRMYLLSLPALAGGLDGWLAEFVPPTTAAPPEPPPASGEPSPEAPLDGAPAAGLPAE